MERIGNIGLHPVFVREYEKIQVAEQTRVFCNHTLSHFLDVARLMYIWNLEDGALLSRDVIYAAALLHDLGRARQYEDGTPHEQGSSILAGEILPECGFTPEEIQQVQAAILSHRNRTADSKLGDYLYRADKASRNCFDCPARSDCNWPETRKNTHITY